MTDPDAESTTPTVYDHNELTAMATGLSLLATYQRKTAAWWAMHGGDATVREFERRAELTETLRGKILADIEQIADASA